MRRLLWLLPIALATALWLIAPLANRTITIQFGQEEGLNLDQAEGRRFYSFLGWGAAAQVEQGYGRRAEGRATIALLWAFRLGAPLELELRSCRCGVTQPLDLSVNGLRLAVPESGGWRDQRLLVDARPSIYERDLLLEWRSPEPPGLVVERISLRAMQPDGRLEGALWLGATLALALLLGRRQPARDQLAWLLAIGTSALVGRLLYQPQLLPWTALVALGGMAAAALTRLAPALPQRLALWAILLWLLAAPQILGTWILDDAFISFRYARNLVDGAGLTFNPGERVEGYTNFLWTLIMAAMLALGYEPAVAAQTLSTALALLTILLLYRLARAWFAPESKEPGAAGPGAPRIRPWRQALALLPPLILALNPAFLLYTTRGSGMETALVALLTIGALWGLWRARTLRSGLLAGLLCALVLLARPDGALVPMAGGLVLLLRLTRRAERAGALPALAGLLLGTLVVYGPYFAWRYSYYGYLLPNTFYAKTGATLAQLQRGLNYTGAFLEELIGLTDGNTPLAWLAGAGLLALLLGSLLGNEIASSANARAAVSEEERPLPRDGTARPPVYARAEGAGPAAFLWSFLLLATLYAIAVGGDHFPLGRFFIAALPPLALLLAHGLDSLWRNAARQQGGWATALRGGALALLLALLGASLARLPDSDSRIAGQPIWQEHKVTMKNIDLGYWLRQSTPQETVVATGIAGAMPYYAQRYVIDALGLNDLHIAHLEVEHMGQGEAGAEKTDVEYILNRKPDYIPLFSAGPFLNVDRFEREYELINVDGPMGGAIPVYKRRSE